MPTAATVSPSNSAVVGATGTILARYRLVSRPVFRSVGHFKKPHGGLSWASSLCSTARPMANSERREQLNIALRGSAWTLGAWLTCVVIGFLPRILGVPSHGTAVTTTLTLALLPLTIAGMAIARGRARRGLITIGVVIAAVAALTLKTLVG